MVAEVVDPLAHAEGRRTIIWFIIVGLVPLGLFALPIVVSRYPVAEVLTQAGLRDSILSLFALVLVVAAAVLVLLSISAARFLVRPVADLSAAVERLERGAANLASTVAEEESDLTSIRAIAERRGGAVEVQRSASAIEVRIRLPSGR